MKNMEPRILVYVTFALCVAAFAILVYFEVIILKTG